MYDIYTAVIQTGFNKDRKILNLNDEVILLKEPENNYDAEAIICVVPAFGKIGYVINNFKALPKGCLVAAGYTIYLKLVFLQK